MRNYLTLFICAMLLACVSVAHAENATEKIEFTGTLVNAPAPVKKYVIRVYQTGSDKRVLDEVTPREDGSFDITVTSDRAVRFVVMDKKRNIVFSRRFFGTDGNNKLELKEIDLSKEK